jgi:hypothetical protein
MESKPMSSKSQSTGSRNINATRISGLRTGSREIEVAAVKVIIMPGYSAPAVNDAPKLEAPLPERPGAWFAERIKAAARGTWNDTWCVSRRNRSLPDGQQYESMMGADGKPAVFGSQADAHAAIRLAEAA